MSKVVARPEHQEEGTVRPRHWPDLGPFDPHDFLTLGQHRELTKEHTAEFDLFGRPREKGV